MTSELQRLKEMLYKDDQLAWEALGRPEGTYPTSNVERLCEEVDRLKKERDSARAEVERLHAVYAIAANALVQAGLSRDNDLPCKAESFMDEAHKVLAEYGPKGQGFSLLAKKIRGMTWNSQIINDLRDENERLIAEVERLRAEYDGVPTYNAVCQQMHETEQELAAAKAEVERLRIELEVEVWNLAGISTIACAENLDHYTPGQPWQRAALTDVVRLVGKLNNARAEIERLRWEETP